MRSFPGVGLLIPVNSGPANQYSPWACGNVASLSFQLGQPQPNAVKPVTKLTVVPTRLSYQADALQAMVTYDNQPLVAFSPAARLTELTNPQGRISMASPLEQLLDISLALTPPLKANPPQGQAVGYSDWARLPYLKFGQRFRFLPFLIGNSGALPAALVKPGSHPAELAPDADAPALEKAIPADLARSVLYLRRVGIGPSAAR